jgi:hypothetical protein
MCWIAPAQEDSGALEKRLGNHLRTNSGLKAQE